MPHLLVSCVFLHLKVETQYSTGLCKPVQHRKDMQTTVGATIYKELAAGRGRGVVQSIVQMKGELHIPNPNRVFTNLTGYIKNLFLLFGK